MVLLRVHNSHTAASRDLGMGNLVLQDEELLNIMQNLFWDAAGCLAKLCY